MAKDGRRFENMDGVSTDKSFKELRQWRKERKAKKKALSYRLPHAQQKETEWLRNNRTQLCVTWSGHATFLIQTGGLNIVTDPVWANWMGIDRRKCEPGIPLAELPEIDIVLISHNHYDHLHLQSLRRLPGRPAIMVPSGLGNWLMRKGFPKVIEFAWWDELSVEGISFAFVPAQHWSRRTLRDMNRSHWGGWVIRSSSSPADEWPLYFAGDSGYFKGFREIGLRYSPKIALMPIGAYEPEWFMAAQHVTPEEAVRAFIDVGAEVFIPMHYGAFRLADDTAKDALDRLYPAWQERRLEQDRLKVLKLGETVKFMESGRNHKG